MHALHPLIVDLMLITLYAAITTLIFKKLKQPMVLGYLLAGILAGPFFNFVPTVTDRENLSLWADIGVIFLLFSLGLEFSFKKMMAVGKSAMITAMMIIFFMLFLGHYTGMFLGWSTTDSLFLGSMISMSSTTIIIKAFDDLNIKKQRSTDLVFGVLVIEDIMGVLMLVLLPAIAVGEGINGGELGLNILKLTAFLILCFVCGIYVIPTILQRIRGFLNDEMLLLIAIALSLSMVYLAVYFGFSAALGAFVMGSILSETGVIHDLERVTKPLKDLFGAVFFVTVGMTVNPQMFVTYAYPIFIITLVVIFGQVIFSSFGFIISGQNLKTAISSAFSLAQVGEFAFIIASLGMSLGVLDDFVYPIIVAVSVITTFLTPIMIKSSPHAYTLMTRIMPEKWLTYINQTTKAQKAFSGDEALWRELLKNSAIRVFLFSFILSAILVFVNKIIRPFVLEWLPNLPARISVTAIALLLMSPFLKGLIGWSFTPSMMGIFKKIPHPNIPHLKFEKPKKLAQNISEPIKNVLQENTESVKDLFTGAHAHLAQIYKQLWEGHRSNRLPLLTLVSFRLMVVAFFIVTAVHQFLTENPKVILLLLIASILLISRSQWLLNQYMKIENRFLDNLNGEETESEE